MLNKLKPKSEFSRNVLTLMTGTAIAQAILINNEETKCIFKNL